MGGGTGGSYSSTGSSLAANVAAMTSKYPLDSAGKLGFKTKQNVQNIKSADPDKTAKEVFSGLSKGGSVAPLSNGKGYIVSFGSSKTDSVVYRPNSKSGGPAISIKTGGRKPLDYKIHFVKEK